MKQLLIIGGGASGLTCAIVARRRGYQVNVVEKNDRFAKKILMTGAGRCNYWNQEMTLTHFHSSEHDYLPAFLNEEDFSKVLPFLDSIGIVPKMKEGYYYPSTYQASTVREALIYEATQLGVELVSSFEVTKIEKKNHRFYVYHNDRVLESDWVVLASGSNSGLKDKNNLLLSVATSFGHTIIPLLPSLVPLKGKGNFFARWDGVRAPVTVSYQVDHQIMRKEHGEVQFTDYGVSGICVFNLSGEINRFLKQGKEVLLQLNFLETYGCTSLTEALSFLEERSHKLSLRSVRILLEGLFHYKLVPLFLDKAQISMEKPYLDLTTEEKSRLASLLLSFPLWITESLSFERSQVTSGGISLAEVDSFTLESLKVKGLYFTGEVLNIDGDCGGYNLGFAWLSGIKVAEGLED